MGREKGRLSGYEMSSATDLSVVLAEMSVMGWKVASCAYHSQESWCSFSWGVVHEMKAVISLLVLPRWCAVLGQRSSNLAVSPFPSARALQSLPVPMCGGKCLVLDCCFPAVMIWAVNSHPLLQGNSSPITIQGGMVNSGRGIMRGFF